MVRQPLERRVGEDQVDGSVGTPAGDVALPPVDVRVQAPGLRQHGFARVEPVHLRVGITPLQQGRVLARSTPQIPDLAGFKSLGQSHQQVQRRAVALGLEAAVLSGIPGGLRGGHLIPLPCGRGWYSIVRIPLRERAADSAVFEGCWQEAAP